MEELERLAKDGIYIQVDGELMNIKVYFSQVTSDNLGMHQLFGFVKGFTANHPCHFCRIDNQYLCHEDPSQFRTNEDHTQDVAAVS